MNEIMQRIHVAECRVLSAVWCVGSLAAPQWWARATLIAVAAFYFAYARKATPTPERPPHE